MESVKQDFSQKLKTWAQSLETAVSTESGQWTIKGFIDIYKNVYTISSDTKIVSKILEIHLFPRLLQFAEQNGFAIVLPEHQNYYPDISLVNLKDEQIKFAIDLKTTYRSPQHPGFCNGFTLGSHGKYFIDRSSSKNIQFPYKNYLGHYCLGIIYSRAAQKIDELQTHHINQLNSITSVINDFQFFVTEKWQIASDKSGSGNTANIGSISKIEDIINGNGMFNRLGESWFDDYWMNYGKISITKPDGQTKKITNLADFVTYRNGDLSLIVPKAPKRKQKITNE